MASPIQNVVGVLGFLIAGLGTATPVQAQYFPLWRANPYMPAIPLGGFSSPWGSFQYGQAQSLSLYKVLPTGQTMNFSFSSYSAGLPLWNNSFVQPIYLGGSSGLSGGFTTNRTYNPTLARIQNEIGIAQKQMASLPKSREDNRDELARWASERTRDTGDNDPLKAVDAAMINPAVEEILNGQILNEIAARIQKLEKAGKRASSSLCPPEMMAVLVFDGGPAADTANAFRKTEPSYPELLASPMFLDQRKGLTEAFSAVATLVHAGKKPELALINQLEAAAKKAHDEADLLVKSASIEQSAAVARFFNELESGCRYLKTHPVGVVGPKWLTTGSTVQELVQHMAKYELRFGPVQAGEESAYFSLHRGLLGYYASLSQAK
jgi:hypothetical protein